MTVTILDGPLGTELLRRGVALPAPRWSAEALRVAPEIVAAIHADYAAAGATIHTANTFRTQQRWLGDDWKAQALLAVALAREAVSPQHRVAGSIAPLEDCYRPDLSPADSHPIETRREHRELACALAEAGCDLLLCETFPHLGEALIAVEVALETGLPVWLSLTAGPNADLLSPEALADGAREALERGASLVLVNCVAASDTLPYVRALAKLDSPFGAYANAARWSPERAPDAVDSALGEEHSVRRYVETARLWVDAGATVIGSCCGTGIAHIRALAEAFDGR